MRERIDDDLFFDRNVVGITTTDPVEDPLSAEFYRMPAPPEPREHPLSRLARHPGWLALLMFGPGFFTVFVNQAPILLQIVLGAPIFEEMLKFGLAFAISLPITWLLQGAKMAGWERWGWLILRFPLGLAVGAGFGIMEHYVTYSSEATSQLYWRVAFHSISTGLSMVILQATLPSADPRVRWGAILPAVLIHYINNTFAVGLLLVALAISADPATFASWFSGGLVLWAAFSVVLFLLAPTSIRLWLERIAWRRLPVRTRPIPPSDGQTPAIHR